MKMSHLNDFTGEFYQILKEEMTPFLCLENRMG